MARCLVLNGREVQTIYVVESIDACPDQMWEENGAWMYQTVLLSSEEYQPRSPLNLSAEEGWLVSGAIVSVWIAAWCFRAIFSLFRGTESVD